MWYVMVLRVRVDEWLLILVSPLSIFIMDWRPTEVRPRLDRTHSLQWHCWLTNHWPGGSCDVLSRVTWPRVSPDPVHTGQRHRAWQQFRSSPRHPPRGEASPDRIQELIMLMLKENYVVECGTWKHMSAVIHPWLSDKYKYYMHYVTTETYYALHCQQLTCLQGERKRIKDKWYKEI